MRVIYRTVQLGETAESLLMIQIFPTDFSGMYYFSVLYLQKAGKTMKTTSQRSGRRNLPPSFVTASQLVFLAENEDEIIMVAR